MNEGFGSIVAFRYLWQSLSQNSQGSRYAVKHQRLRQE